MAPDWMFWAQQQTWRFQMYVHVMQQTYLERS
nr:MAG TPA: hypothetical protein [Caudoviricetes sp.]